MVNTLARTHRAEIDALLKLGYTQAELKHFGQARTTLTSVSTRFPGSDAANLAAARLLQLPAQ